MQMVVDHVRTAPEPPSRRTSQVIPEALERVVLRCLEKDPASRPASIEELSSELKSLGVESLWTEERARHWWSAHPPEGHDGLASLPEIDSWTSDTHGGGGRLKGASTDPPGTGLATVPGLSGRFDAAESGAGHGQGSSVRNGRDARRCGRQQ
jgi:hypothetical protein